MARILKSSARREVRTETVLARPLATHSRYWPRFPAQSWRSDGNGDMWRGLLGRDGWIAGAGGQARRASGCHCRRAESPHNRQEPRGVPLFRVAARRRLPREGFRVDATPIRCFERPRFHLRRVSEGGGMVDLGRRRRLPGGQNGPDPWLATQKDHCKINALITFFWRVRKSR